MLKSQNHTLFFHFFPLDFFCFFFGGGGGGGVGVFSEIL